MSTFLMWNLKHSQPICLLKSVHRLGCSKISQVAFSQRPTVYMSPYLRRSQGSLFQLHCPLLLRVCKVSWGVAFPTWLGTPVDLALYTKRALFHASQLWFIGAGMCVISTLQPTAKDPKSWKQCPPSNPHQAASPTFLFGTETQRLLCCWDKKILQRA